MEMLQYRMKKNGDEIITKSYEKYLELIEEGYEGNKEYIPVTAEEIGLRKEN